MIDGGETSAAQGVGDVIRLAVAPVFLLSGVGIMLTVFTNRLARTVDRARELERRAAQVPEADHAHEIEQPLATLARRGRLLNAAIALCTICALLVAVVIVVLFLGESFDFRISYVIDALFIAAMLSFIGAILCFLREVFIATATLRIGLRRPR
ncbi:MAG TPA: DUF2721 domain-containing protein [Steroidobacteraceae bacterium]|nr:DUF2721 domain-containing protein [Steroidobacteraceae bacterium]